jgi:hypothetical protein
MGGPAASVHMGSIPDHAPLSVSVENQLPQDLYDAMRDFVRCHPQWDQYRLMQAALAGFLFQHGCQDRAVVRHYLDGLFRRQGQTNPQATATVGSPVGDPTLKAPFDGGHNNSALPISPLAGNPVAVRRPGSRSMPTGCAPQCPLA